MKRGEHFHLFRLVFSPLYLGFEGADTALLVKFKAHMTFYRIIPQSLRGRHPARVIRVSLLAIPLFFQTSCLQIMGSMVASLSSMGTSIALGLI